MSGNGSGGKRPPSSLSRKKPRLADASRARRPRKSSKKTLLVHTCCGPCLLYPHKRLQDRYEITVFFFNPNIHPRWEWAKRRDVAQRFCGSDLGFVDVDYVPNAWSQEVLTGGNDPVPDRCRRCYALRLDQTAAYAKEHGFEAFTTTLLVSPQQDHDAVLMAGMLASEEHGVAFLGEDFREGYKWGVGRSRQLRMYRQNYCGCVLSLIERGPVHRLAQGSLTKS